jgi:hypothetical protein
MTVRRGGKGKGEAAWPTLTCIVATGADGTVVPLLYPWSCLLPPIALRSALFILMFLRSSTYCPIPRE